MAESFFATLETELFDHEHGGMFDTPGQARGLRPDPDVLQPAPAASALGAVLNDHFAERQVGLDPVSWTRTGQD